MYSHFSQHVHMNCSEADGNFSECGSQAVSEVLDMKHTHRFCSLPILAQLSLRCESTCCGNCPLRDSFDLFLLCPKVDTEGKGKC